ncbi:MAG: dTDP-4-dehydrorhamnose reductase [Hellea sp.]
MSILIFGKNGQLSRALQRSLTARNAAFSCYGRNELDLIAHPENAAALIRRSKPDAVINACAFTDVDGAETRTAEANILNAKAPGIMAASCQAARIPFIHISTDYVFDGQKTEPYRPADRRNPLNVYGRSKAAGERAVMAAGGQSLILRTSWVYDGTGQNFLTAMLRLAKTNSALSLVSNQFGRPTYAGHLAEACLAALNAMPRTSKTYHVSNSGPIVSWAGFAAAIFERAGLRPDITHVTEAHFPRPAKRPANSAFDINDFERDFQHPMEPWTAGLELAFQEMKR